MRVPQIKAYRDPAEPDLEGVGGLALSLQEALTVVARLRAERTIARDAESFRAHVKKLLAAANQDARAAGYSDESVRLAVYAFVALLDESVLASSQPMFAGWSRQPLQEEVFGEHTAGETFFRHLEDLVARPLDAETADVLEVYQLCLLLGFHGRFRDDRLQIERFREAAAQRVERMRGERALSPDWRHPVGETVTAPRDRWIRPLVLTGATVLVIFVLTFITWSVLLGGRVDALRATASQVLGVG